MQQFWTLFDFFRFLPNLQQLGTIYYLIPEFYQICSNFEQYLISLFLPDVQQLWTIFDFFISTKFAADLRHFGGGFAPLQIIFSTTDLLILILFLPNLQQIYATFEGGFAPLQIFYSTTMICYFYEICSRFMPLSSVISWCSAFGRAPNNKFRKPVFLKNRDFSAK